MYVPGLVGAYLAGNVTIANAIGTGIADDKACAEIMRAVIHRVRSRPNVRLFTNSFTIDLLTHEGACVGAHVQLPQQGPLLVWAKQVILAAGIAPAGPCGDPWVRQWVASARPEAGGPDSA